MHQSTDSTYCTTHARPQAHPHILTLASAEHVATGLEVWLKQLPHPMLALANRHNRLTPSVCVLPAGAQSLRAFVETMATRHVKLNALLEVGEVARAFLHCSCFRNIQIGMPRIARSLARSIDVCVCVCVCTHRRRCSAVSFFFSRRPSPSSRERRRRRTTPSGEQQGRRRKGKGKGKGKVRYALSR